MPFFCCFPLARSLTPGCCSFYAALCCLYVAPTHCVRSFLLLLLIFLLACVYVCSCVLGFFLKQNLRTATEVMPFRVVWTVKKLERERVKGTRKRYRGPFCTYACVPCSLLPWSHSLGGGSGVAFIYEADVSCPFWGRFVWVGYKMINDSLLLCHTISPLSGEYSITPADPIGHS